MRRVLNKFRGLIGFEDRLCLFILFAVAILVTYPLLFQAKVPIGGNGLSGLPPWDEGEVASAVDTTSDIDLEFARYYGAFRFLNDTVHNGDSLLWNPGQFAGVPFLAQWWTRCLSPFSLPFYLFGMQTAFAISSLLKLVVAGWLAYYVVRMLGLSGGFGLFVGLGQQLSGFLLLSLHHPASDVMPWIPLLFLYTERLSIGQGRYWPTGALVMALMLLGGDPVGAAAAIAFFTCYFFARVHRKSDQIPLTVPILSAVFSVVLAFAVAATQILPSMEWWLNSEPIDSPHGPLPTLAHLIGLLLPNWDTPAAAPGLERAMGLFFIGPLQLLLVCLWVTLRIYAPQAHRRRVDALLSLSAGLVLLTLTLATASNYISQLPGFFRPEHLLIACPFALALGCAAAAEAWLQLKPAQCIVVLKRFTSLLLIVLIVVGLSLAVAPYAGLTPAAEFTLQSLALLFCSLLVIALIGITLLKPRVRLLGYGLAAIVVAQSITVFGPIVSFSTQEELYPETSFIAALQDRSTRVGGSPALARWPLGVNGIQTFYGSGDRAPTGYLDFARHLNEDPGMARRTSPEVLLLTREDLQGAYRVLRPTLRTRKVAASGLVLFDCLDCGKPEEPPESSQGTFGTTAHAKVGTGQHFPSGSPAASSRGEGSARYLGPGVLDKNARIMAVLDGVDGDVVVLTNTYYPGWRAFVDDFEEEVFRTDDLFMGVDTPKGSRAIVFSYEPQPVYWGRIVSTGAGILVLLGLGNLFYFRLQDSYFRT